MKELTGTGNQSDDADLEFKQSLYGGHSDDYHRDKIWEYPIKKNKRKMYYYDKYHNKRSLLTNEILEE